MPYHTVVFELVHSSSKVDVDESHSTVTKYFREANRAGNWGFGWSCDTVD